MSLTKIGSIGINTGIQFAGVTTVSTLKVGSGVTVSSDGDIFATGISTFSEDIKVGSGITLSPDGDGFYTGVVTATTFSGALSGSGANISAINASNITSGTVPTARLGSGTASSSTFLRGDSSFQTITTDLVADTSPQLGNTLDMNGHSIVGGDSAGATSNRIKLGTGEDLLLYHDGTDNFIQTTGKLYISSNTFVDIRSHEDETMIKATPNGAVELYHDNTKMIETISTGTNIPDGKFAKFGNSNDMSMGHNTYNYITYTGADFLITGDSTNQIKLQPKSDEAAIICKPNAEVELFHDGTLQCETSANGLAFPSGKGIDFSATGDASGSSSELLDDYEEGLWTPTFSTSSGSVTVNASYDKVTYTKIGRVVHLVGQAVVGVNSPSGNLTIGGLPFTVGNYDDLAGRNFCLFMMYANGSGVPDGSSYYVIHGRMLEGNNDFLCEGVKPHADGSIADWCGNGSDFFFDITYVAAT